MNNLQQTSNLEKATRTGEEGEARGGKRVTSSDPSFRSYNEAVRRERSSLNSEQGVTNSMQHNIRSDCSVVSYEKR